MRQLILNPSLHARVVTLLWPPLSKLLSRRSRFNVDEAWEAVHLVSLRRQPVTRTIHLDELDLLTILSFELVHNSVPLGHELDTVGALWHEKVDDDDTVAMLLQQLKEVLGALRLHTFGLVPPLLCCHFVLATSIGKG